MTRGEAEDIVVDGLRVGRRIGRLRALNPRPPEVVENVPSQLARKAYNAALLMAMREAGSVGAPLAVYDFGGTMRVIADWQEVSGRVAAESPSAVVRVAEVDVSRDPGSEEYVYLFPEGAVPPIIVSYDGIRLSGDVSPELGFRIGHRSEVYVTDGYAIVRSGSVAAVTDVEGGRIIADALGVDEFEFGVIPTHLNPLIIWSGGMFVPGRLLRLTPYSLDRRPLARILWSGEEIHVVVGDGATLLLCESDGSWVASVLLGRGTKVDVCSAAGETPEDAVLELEYGPPDPYLKAVVRRALAQLGPPAVLSAGARPVEQ